MSPLDELAALLKPAGGGVYLVSTGKAEQQRLQRQLYRASTDAEVDARWRATLARISTARGVVLGVPSDVGAGFIRGANMGPQALRQRLLADDAAWPEEMESLGLLDVGDVLCVPQLLHDSMLSDSQLSATRAALYPGVTEVLPVSPLSIAQRAWALMLQLNPALKLFTLGGDHSTALPLVLALAESGAAPTPWGVVQIDAHTDLLEARLGVKYCFGTWSWHANEALGRHGRLTQVGIRASGRPRQHWEGTLGVRQFWAAEVLADSRKAIDAIVAHVRSTGVRGVYFSNDIDGTDASYADATGTPEPGGLEPDTVVELIRRLGRDVGLLGGDVMEVAPVLTRTPDSAARTVGVGARYFRETVRAALAND